MTTTTAALTSTAKIGRWWFQRRSVSTLPLFLAMAFLPPDFHWQGPEILFAIAGIVLAECLRIWAVGYAGSATRTRGDSVPQLVHAGPFRHVRNPLYVANILLYTCASIMFGFIYLSAIVFVYSCVQYTFIVAFEESTLERLFGKPYDEYRAKVSRWLPSITPRVPSTPQEFSLSKALVSEKSTFFSISLVVAVYLLKRFITKA